MVSEALLDGARGLVVASAVKSASRAKRIGWGERMQWAAVAAGVFVACLGGFGVGSTIFEGQQIVQASISSEASFEFDGFGFAEGVEPNGRNGGEI